MLNIQYSLKPDRRTEQFKPEKKLPFGELCSEHMFLMEYSEGEWHSPRIVPFGPLIYTAGRRETQVMPNTAVLHYSQSVFEGAKGFRHEDGEIHLFRIDENANRLNNSAEMVCAPNISVENQIHSIEALMDVDRLWVPEQEGASMYVRPVIINIQEVLGVKAGIEYLYYVMLSPSGPYYPHGFNPGKMLLTDKYKRVAPKSTGTAKTGGNYAASLRAGKIAKEMGAQQVLYLDVYDKYLEEYGAMNHYQVTKDGEIIIPEFTDTILKSITSCSFLELGDELGHPVRQEKILALDFIIDLFTKNITECGALGTAAVVSPVGKYLLDIGERKRKEMREATVNDGNVGPVSRKMYELYTGIQYGRIEDKKGWLRKVERMS